jgi:hypothetical protein
MGIFLARTHWPIASNIGLLVSWQTMALQDVMRLAGVLPGCRLYDGEARLETGGPAVCSLSSPSSPEAGACQRDELS